ncbi:MAG TPA: TIGR03118 family protein [Steroidobacteraceae bacterium]
MDVKHALRGGVIGVIGALMLNACGGGSYGGGNGGGAYTAMPAVVTLTVTPATINLGQSVTLTWSSSAGTSCTAGGAWSGALSASGTQSVTPPAVGTASFTIACAGGAFSNASASSTVTVNAASAFSLTSLVADTSGGMAAHVDPNLVNAWGLSIPAAPATAPAWVANNHSETSTLYDGTGNPIPLVVTFAASLSGTTFDPTGIVFNPSATDFLVSSGATSGVPKFIFDGEGGMIAGWAPNVAATAGVTMYADAGGAVYKGLAVAANGGAWFLYAADFHNAKVDVFDTHYAKQASSASAFTFADPSLPAGYAPFGIQAINNGAAGATQIYVSYAKQQAPDNHDESDGAGLGYVDVFDANGQLIKQLIAGGWLNAPWGVALAPADFGTLSNALLVGNFGDGTINGYDPSSGAHLGAITNAGGTAIAVAGVWGIAFGNDAVNQPHNTLFVAAGPNAEANGSYGRIDLGAAPPVLGAAPVVTLTVPASPLVASVVLSATVTDAIAVTKVDFWVNTTLVGTATTSPYTVNWNTTAWPNGAVSIEAKAWDANGNVGSSAPSAATITN